MMDAEEKKQMKKLMKEKKQAEERLDWMYKKNLNPDSEDYLLGRKIDKIFEHQDEDEPDDKNTPGAIFNDRIKANIAMDMAAKMREDPLFQIRKREEDAKKQLLQNPVKMKQLQKLVKERQKGKHKKKKKKKEKKKKNKGNSSDDDSEDDDDDDELMKKYLAVLSKKHNHATEETSGGRKKERGHDSGEIRDKGDNRAHSESNKKRHDEVNVRRQSSSESPVKSPNPRSHREHKHEERTKNGSQRKRHSVDSDDERPKQKQYGLVIKGEPNAGHQKRSPSRSPKRKSRSPKTKSPKKRSKSPKLKRNGSPVRSNSPVRRNRSPAKRSRSPRKRSRSPMQRSSRRSRSRSPPKRKLTDEEKQRKLEEMHENAKWRDEQREKNVKRYKAETEREERSHLNKGSSSDFINPLMASHASQSSVADRIKRNIYNVQRTKADLDKDFMKR